MRTKLTYRELEQIAFEKGYFQKNGNTITCAILSSSVRDKITYFLEIRFIHKNGGIIRTNLSVGCMRKPDHSVDYFVSIFQNISKRKQAEEASRES